jgi:uncharacterized protein YvpB
MGMSLSELGEAMSDHELTVIWPEFFKSRRRMQRWQEKQ